MSRTAPTAPFYTPPPQSQVVFQALTTPESEVPTDVHPLSPRVFSGGFVASESSSPTEVRIHAHAPPLELPGADKSTDINSNHDSRPVVTGLLRGKRQRTVPVPAPEMQLVAEQKSVTFHESVHDLAPRTSRLRRRRRPAQSKEGEPDVSQTGSGSSQTGSGSSQTGSGSSQTGSGSSQTGSGSSRQNSAVGASKYGDAAVIIDCRDDKQKALRLLELRRQREQAQQQSLRNDTGKLSAHPDVVLTNMSYCTPIRLNPLRQTETQEGEKQEQKTVSRRRKRKSKKKKKRKKKTPRKQANEEMSAGAGSALSGQEDAAQVAASEENGKQSGDATVGSTAGTVAVDSNEQDGEPTIAPDNTDKADIAAENAPLPPTARAVAGDAELLLPEGNRDLWRLSPVLVHKYGDKL